PTPDGLRCTNAKCPASGEQCVPKCATFRDGQLVRVEECDCTLQGECRIVPPPPGAILPQCEGSCPPGTVCNQRLTTNADGSVTICCECVPEQPDECRPNEERTACEGPCPDPTTGSKC